MLKILIALLFSLKTFAVERPNLAIDLESNFICFDGKSLNGKKFNTSCSVLPNTPNKILHIYPKLKDSIIYHSQLITDSGIGNLGSWCYKVLIDPNTGRPGGNPSCHFEATNLKTGFTALLNFQFVSNSNLISINIYKLKVNTKYKFILKEITSRSESLPFIIDSKDYL